MLIDADNTQLSKLESVIQEISTNGRIVVKRAYGNWRKGSLKNWENELKRLAIKAEQQKVRQEEQDYAAVRRNVEEFLAPPRQERQKHMELE